MLLYWAVAVRAFRRQLTYRAANLAGLITNCCFGYLRAVIFFAVYAAQRTVAGYDLSDAVTYTWVGQALIMVVALWGWWEIEDTIRSGDVVSDLAKPFSYLGFWLARDYGRGVAFLLTRCVPIFLIGQVTFGLRWPRYPQTWLYFALSVFLAITISFGWRFLINVSAFWTTDARGLGGLLSIVITLFSGLIVPLNYFPPGLQAVLLALPFAGLIQTPADLFLEHDVGIGALVALGEQALWAVVFLVASRLLLTVAVRRVVVQGG
ncbi:MAG TPA: ABC-2 family transporter protein [Chloroflexota bacterium]|nr:ABC-2 family transporter protein [Chloroflexota bacterium]